MLAFLLPAHIVSKNYYYFANNSHLRIQFFWLHSSEIVSVKNGFLYGQINRTYAIYINVDADDKNLFH